MMRHNLNLNWLRSFEASARLLSFTAASHEIGLTQAAVSQHIKALETQLGDRLFVRRAKSLQLTDMGKAYLLTVREALETIEHSTAGLFGPRQDRTITLRASMAFLMWISPRLADFLATQPDIGIKLITSIWKAPSDQQPADIDIILAPNQRAQPNMDLLSPETIVPICSAVSGDGPTTPGELSEQPPIHIMGFDDHLARYLSAFSLAPARSGPGVITDTSTAAMEMVAAGLGCAVVIERFARQAIESGQKIRICGAPIALGQSHYLVQAPRRAEVRSEVDAFEIWLRQQF